MKSHLFLQDRCGSRRLRVVSGERDEHGTLLAELQAEVPIGASLETASCIDGGDGILILSCGHADSRKAKAVCTHGVRQRLEVLFGKLNVLAFFLEATYFIEEYIPLDADAQKKVIWCTQCSIITGFGRANSVWLWRLRLGTARPESLNRANVLKRQPCSTGRILDWCRLAVLGLSLVHEGDQLRQLLVTAILRGGIGCLALLGLSLVRLGLGLDEPSAVMAPPRLQLRVVWLQGLVQVA